jgi:hypothetical protein
MYVSSPFSPSGEGVVVMVDFWMSMNMDAEYLHSGSGMWAHAWRVQVHLLYTREVPQARLAREQQIGLLGIALCECGLLQVQLAELDPDLLLDLHIFLAGDVLVLRLHRDDGILVDDLLDRARHKLIERVQLLPHEAFLGEERINHVPHGPLFNLPMLGLVDLGVFAIVVIHGCGGANKTVLAGAARIK